MFIQDRLFEAPFPGIDCGIEYYNVKAGTLGPTLKQFDHRRLDKLDCLPCKIFGQQNTGHTPTLLMCKDIMTYQHVYEYRLSS
jgi:hypothetical protein